MRKVIPLLLLTASLPFSVNAFYRPQGDQEQSSSCLRIDIQPAFTSQDEKTVIIKLYNRQTGVEKTDSIIGAYKSFILAKNEDYVITLQRTGYVTKQICVSTHLPDDIDLRDIFTFDCIVEMIEDPAPMLFKEARSPIAYIKYSYAEECFLHNRKYTKRMKRELKAVIETLKLQESPKEIASAP